MNSLIATKRELLEYLLQHNGLDTSDLSRDMVSWLDQDDPTSDINTDKEGDTNEIIDWDNSGQGGYTLWTRKITINNHAFILDYNTAGENLTSEFDVGVSVDVKRIIM